MTSATLPLGRDLISQFGRWARETITGEIEMSDRDPVAAARRVSEAEDTYVPRPVPRHPFAEDIDMRLSDIRDAAILNTILLAKSHGLSSEVTESDVERWRKIRSLTNDIASGSNEAESIPVGFGPATRARQTDAMVKIAAKMNAATAEAPSSVENGKAS